MSLPAILMLVVIALGVLVWNYYPDQQEVTFDSVGTQNDATQAARPEAPTVAAQAGDSLADSRQTNNIEQASIATADQQPASAEIDSPVPGADDDTTAGSVEETPETESAILLSEEQPVSQPLENQPVSDESQPITTAAAELTGEQSEPIVEPATDIKQPAADPTQVVETPEIVEPELTIYQRRLRASEQWLTESADSTSSIQLMLLGFEIDAEQAIEQYLDRILARGIEAENIMLYSTIKNQRRVIGVLYGVYPDRQQARQNMRTLPRALNANKPIIRTVKGIKDEISSDLRQN